MISVFTFPAALWSAEVQWCPSPVYSRREVKKTAKMTMKAEAKIPVAPEHIDKSVPVMLYPALQIHAFAVEIVEHAALVMQSVSSKHGSPTFDTQVLESASAFFPLAHAQT